MAEDYKSMTEEALKERLKLIREVRNSRPQVQKDRAVRVKKPSKPKMDLDDVPEINID